ncbi:MAG: hypothetical protein HY812_14665 [Planctomycetes bacterium]|nr:hypothetical protein [Planctomycetota bacterium]
MLRLAIPAVAATVAFFALGFLGEGWLLREHFLPYQALYRMPEQLQRFMPIGMVALFLGNLVVAAIYAKWCNGRPGASSGLRFGLLVGVFVACVHPIANLLTMNLGLRLGIEITAATFVQWAAVGMVLGSTCRPR